MTTNFPVSVSTSTLLIIFLQTPLNVGSCTLLPLLQTSHPPEVRFGCGAAGEGQSSLLAAGGRDVDQWEGGLHLQWQCSSSERGRRVTPAIAVCILHLNKVDVLHQKWKRHWFYRNTRWTLTRTQELSRWSWSLWLQPMRAPSLSSFRTAKPPTSPAWCWLEMVCCNEANMLRRCRFVRFGFNVLHRYCFSCLQFLRSCRRNPSFRGKNGSGSRVRPAGQIEKVKNYWLIDYPTSCFLLGLPQVRTLSNTWATRWRQSAALCSNARWDQSVKAVDRDCRVQHL